MDKCISIHNAQQEYLNTRTVPVTIKTLLLDKETRIFKKIIKWCEKAKNVEGSWAMEQEEDRSIYFKFWQSKEAEKFKKKFKKYIDNTETF